MTGLTMDQTVPVFRTESLREGFRVILQCSKCHADLRELKKGQTVDVRRAYYCAACDPGVVVLNMSKTSLSKGERK